MVKRIVKWAVSIALISVCLLVYACGSGQEVMPIPQAAGASAIAPTPEPSVFSASAPIAAMDKVVAPTPTLVESAAAQATASTSGIEGILPYSILEGGNFARENANMQSLSSEDVSNISAAVNAEGYAHAQYVVTVTYRTDDILSCLVMTDDTTRNASSGIIPITLQNATGAVLKLGDFFSDADIGWRWLLPDLVTEAAQEKGVMLLCEVPPVDAYRPFFILDGAIVLLYRPYEITTYEEGSPCFVLPMDKLQEYTTGAYGIGGTQ